MLKKITSLLASSLLVLSFSVTADGGHGMYSTKSHKNKPDNLKKVFTFISTRPFDSVDGTFFLDGMVAGDGMNFFKNIMGYSDAEIAQNRQDAIAFYQERFGLDVNDPRLYFTGFQIDPAADYRAVLVSGKKRNPGKGYPILDGGWALAVVDPAGIDLGGEFVGTHVPAGTMFAAGGSYVLKRGNHKKDIVIDYQSRGPMQPVGRGGVINCEVTSDKYGDGVAWGYFEFHPLSNGQIAAQVRNVVTFPGFGYEEDMIEN